MGGAVVALSITIGGATNTPSVINPMLSAYGAVGDGVADDTSALQAAVTAAAAAKGTLWLPPNKLFLCGNVTLADGIREITGPGSSFKQKVASTNLFTNSGVIADPLTIRDVGFIGVAGTTPADGNSAIRFVSAGAVKGDIANVTIRRCLFTNWQHHPIRIGYARDITIDDNRFVANCGNAQLTSCDRGHITNNKVRSTQTTDTSVAGYLPAFEIGAWSNTPSATQHSSACIFSGNETTSWVVGPSIMSHDCDGLNIIGNIFRDSLIGVIVGPNQGSASNTQRLSSVMVIGNTYYGTDDTTRVNYAHGNQFLLLAGGDADNPLIGALVAYNLIEHGNYAEAGNNGAIWLDGGVQNAEVSHNRIRDCKGSAIRFATNNSGGLANTGITLRDNDIRDMVATAAPLKAGIWAQAGANTGEIIGNRIDGVTDAILAQSDMSGFKVLRAEYGSSVTNRLTVNGAGVAPVLGETVIVPHAAAATPTGGQSGEIRIANGKIWINDAGTWKSVAVA